VGLKRVCFVPSPEGIMTCAACSCSRGDTLYVHTERSGSVEARRPRVPEGRDRRHRVGAARVLRKPSLSCACVYAAAR
jgi:hypothetical protein